MFARGDRPGARELSGAIGDELIMVVEIEPIVLDAANLDVGEASTLPLAIEHSGRCLVVMDETIGRSCVSAHELNVAG